jgi:hypothetical protein
MLQLGVSFADWVLDETVKSSGMNTRAENVDNSLHICEPYRGGGWESFYDASCLVLFLYMMVV